MATPEICASCGVEITDKYYQDELCGDCTLNGTIDPIFDSIVFAMAFGYFEQVENIEDPKVAIEKAWNIISQKKYWIGKDVPDIGKFFEKFLLKRKEIESYRIFSVLEEGSLIEKPADFYFSYSLKSPIVDIVRELIKNLEIQGYIVQSSENLLKLDTKKDDMEIKEIISRAITCIPIISKDYLSNVDYNSELSSIFELQDKILPIWSSEITNSNELNQFELGKEILGMVGLSWNDHKGDIGLLFRKLVQFYQVSKGKIFYNGVMLHEQEAQAMFDLEVIVGAEIPYLSKGILDDEDKPNSGFYVEDDYIVEIIPDRNKLFKMLPDSFYNLFSLRKFVGKVTEISEKVERLVNLTYLELHHGNISTLPNSIGKLTSLKFLYLNTNKLSTLPESFGDLKSLEILHLNNNKLIELPKSFGNLESLQILYLSSTTINSLPESFGNLRSLKFLNLSSTTFSTLPNSFGYLAALEELIFRYAKITTLPESFGNLKSLKKLSFQDAVIESFPESFGNLTGLEELIIIAPTLSIFPIPITKLVSLKKLEYKKSNLKSIPDSIDNMSSLEILNLQDNQLSALPKTIINLKSLKVLNLSGSEIGSSLKIIGNMSNLIDLNIANNKLKKLPKIMGNLKSLEILNIGVNFFESPPPIIRELISLKELNLEGNNLFSFPDLFIHLKHLSVEIGANRFSKYTTVVVMKRFGAWRQQNTYWFHDRKYG